MGENKHQKSSGDFELSITKELKQRKNPFLRPIFTVAAIGALFMIFGLVLQMMADSKKEALARPAVDEPENLHLTVHGEGVCLCCTLQLSTQHHRAIRYRGDGNKQRVILLQENSEQDMNLDYFCNGPTPLLVEGDILVTNDFRILQASTFKAFPEERK